MNSLIEHLNEWGGDFVGIAWPICWQSSLLIALLFAGDLLLRRKLRASLRYALWLVVLIKLCVPPTLALPTSPVWWFHTSPPPVMAKPSLPPTTVTYNEGPQLDLPPIAEQPVYTPPPARLSAFGWLLLAAVGISAGLLVWMLARWWQVTRLVRRAYDSEWLTALADDARHDLRLRGPVPVKLTAQAMSPAVCGLFQPVILMPQSLATSLSEEQLRAVLLHELIHLRRGDVWVNLVQTLLQIGYWWHPLVWLANARLRRVREEAVDDAVMVALRGEAGLYAPTLLAVAKLALNRPLATLGLVGIMESRSVLRQRIERLLDFHPPRRAGLTVVSLLGVLAFTAVAVPMGAGPAPLEKEMSPAPVVSSSLTIWPLTNQPVLFTAFIYQMGDAELAATVKGLQFKPANAGDDSCWVASPDQYRQLATNLAASGLQPLTRPRIQTGSGHPAQMFVGDATDGFELDCTPFIIGERIEVAMAGSRESASEATTNSFSAKTSVENEGGIVVCAKSFDGAAKAKLVVVMQLVTNAAAMRLNGILKPAGAQATNAAAASMSPQGSISGGGTNSLSQTALRALEQRSNNNSSGEPEVTASSGRQTQLRGGNALANSIPAKMESGQLKPEGKKPLDGQNNRRKVFDLLHTIRFDLVTFDQLPLSEVLRNLSEQSRRRDPEGAGLNFMIDPAVAQNLNSAVDPATGLPATPHTSGIADLSALPITVTMRTNVLLGEVLDAVVQSASQPIHYSVHDYAVVFSAGGPQSQLFSRMFVLDTGAFISQLRKMKGVGEEFSEATNASAVTLAARKYVASLGVNLESPTGKAVVFNDQTGGLLVKASVVDLDVVERALGALDIYRHSVSATHAKTAAALVLEGKIHYEMGNLAAAEKVLKEALALEPGNAAAQYYLDLIQAARRARKNSSPPPPAVMPQLNRNQLNEVQLNRFGPFDHLPLDQALRQVNAAIQPGEAGKLRLTAAASARAVNINLPTAVEPASLLNALAALVGSASQPIKFSLQEDGVIFSLKAAPEPDSLLTRTYKVDTKAFLANFKEAGRSLDATYNSPPAIAEVAAKLLGEFGVNLDSAKGRSVLFNDRAGILIVHATEAELDEVERVVQRLNRVPPQIHLKAWFYEVPEKFADLLDKVPGVTNGVTAVLTPATSAELSKTIHSIRGVQVLGAPEVTTRLGLQCQVETVDVVTIVTNIAYCEIMVTNELAHGGIQVTNISGVTPQVTSLKCGPVLEVLPVLAEDERTIQLTTTASVTKFFGYAGPHRNFFGYADPSTNTVMTSAGDKIRMPDILPVTQANEVSASLNLAGGQTVVLFPQPNQESDPRRVQFLARVNKKNGNKLIVVLVTASLVDSGGNLLAQTAAPAK